MRFPVQNDLNEQCVLLQLPFNFALEYVIMKNVEESQEEL